MIKLAVLEAGEEPGRGARVRKAELPLPGEIAGGGAD